MKKKFIYDYSKEYVNIDNYSPFWFLNEVSPQYQKNPFTLPFVEIDQKLVPVHPDTFSDLHLSPDAVKKEILVYPTSSFRTLYYPPKNVCYKVPLLRRITRSIRDLQPKQLQKSQRASQLLSSLKIENFSFLPEICHPSQNPNFNYIERIMPETETYPWFYVISSQKFTAEYEIKCMTQVIQIWMMLASLGIYLEGHTQNILVDANCHTYYRDLSDVRSYSDPILQPSYAAEVAGVGDVLATIFDRTVCNQNLDHLFRYNPQWGLKERNYFKELIRSEIEKYQLPFPKYSMDYPVDKPVLTPQKTALIFWRNYQ